MPLVAAAPGLGAPPGPLPPPSAVGLAGTSGVEEVVVEVVACEEVELDDVLFWPVVAAIVAVLKMVEVNV